jgi:hypothetical protein
MTDPWRGAQPLPEAAADPIVPDAPTPKPSRVNSPFLSAYQSLTDSERTSDIDAIAKRIRDGYLMRFPVGTFMPLTINGRDFLAVFQWHTNRVPSGAPGVEIMKPRSGMHTELIVEALRGRWLVTFDTGWSWFYTFLRGNRTFCTDIKDPPELEAHGSWSFDGRSVQIRWRTSSEEWFRPLLASGIRGRSLVGQGDLSAEKDS